ncbi:MAG: hypothetical protein Q9162_007139 [Coniocarpon cinnabarinum]
MSTQPLLQGAPGKRIALPPRLEPKVFFANERTFLSWLNFSVLLGGLAIGLLNFGDRVGQLSALLFTIVAMAGMVYALGVFHWRANRIRQRGGSQMSGGFGGFDDRWGPTVLTGALVAAVVVNFVLRTVGSGQVDEGHDGLKLRRSVGGPRE